MSLSMIADTVCVSLSVIVNIVCQVVFHGQVASEAKLEGAVCVFYRKTLSKNPVPANDLLTALCMSKDGL